MDRIACLQELLALEEQRVPLMRKLDKLDERLAELRKALPPRNASAKVPGMSRLVCLRKIVAVEEAREALVARIMAINERSQPLRKSIARKPKGYNNPHRRKQGELGQEILSKLKAAGRKGIRVCELAQQVAYRGGSLRTWLIIHSKRTPQIVKLARGRYAFDPARSSA